MEKFVKLNEEIIDNIIVGDNNYQDNNYIKIENGDINDLYNIGDTYNVELNIIILKQPYDLWSLDSNYIWVPPIPIPYDSNRPNDLYAWSDIAENWILVEFILTEYGLEVSEDFFIKMNTPTTTP